MRRMPGWVKRADRSPVSVSGSLSLSDGRTLPVTITDMSSEGCKIDAEAVLPIGDVVELEIPDQDRVRASIRWSILGTAGLRFV